METDLTSNAAPRLLDQVRGKIRLKHYSIRTEQSYLDWIKPKSGSYPLVAS